MHNKLIYYNLSLKESVLAILLIFALFIHASELKGQENEVLYRVNAGGPQFEDEPISWSTDQAATSVRGVAKKGTPSPYLTFTNISDEDQAYAIPTFTDGTNETGYSSGLFATERFSNSRNKISQTWDFPVSIAGTYTVNLLFAEIWENAQQPGVRIFGISIEDSVVADSLDLVAEVGWKVATVKTYEVEVSDGNLDINLLKIKQNPAIKGIEIIGPAGANANLPPQFTSVPLVRGEAGETLNATFTTSEKDGDPVSLALTVKTLSGDTLISDSTTYTFTDNGDGTGTLVWATQPTDIFSYNATITATDKDGTASKNFTITVSEKVKNILYRINAGGMELQDASDTLRLPFSADLDTIPSAHRTGGEIYQTDNPVTLHSSVPAYVPIELFQTERFSDSMQWSFPVPAGTSVNVRFYLAEIFLREEGVNSNESIGPRVFDIIIDEDTVEKAIDVFEEVGADVGIMRSYYVISDSAINIRFGAIAEFPSIKGIEIIQADSLIVTVTKQDATCFGGNGSAVVEVTGGIGPYEINWGNEVNPEQLLAGTYEVTISDAGGQQVVQEVIINQPEALAVTITTENATPGASDGSASASVSGGVEPYAYNWGEGVNPEALSAGNYTLTVTDSLGCTASKEFTIGDPDSLVVGVQVTNPSCFGGTGSAEVSITGGTEPYEVVWADGVNPEALPAGEYTVTVSDTSGQQVEKKVTITQPETELNIEVNTTDASEFGASDGSAALEVSGGTAPYSIIWGDIDPNALPAGTYNVTVKDAIGCEKEVEITIEQPAELTVEITKTDATCEAAGTATLDIQGGTFPYDVAWGNNANPDSLAAGTYQVVVTDANDVSVTKEVEIILDCEGPVATEDPKEKDLLLKLYPVPVDNFINISVPSSIADKEGMMRIYTTDGQKILEQQVNTLDLPAVHVGHLSKGTYILEITTKDKVLKSRFLLK